MLFWCKPWLNILSVLSFTLFPTIGRLPHIKSKWFISSVSEIIIKTGEDGTNADITAKICDGAGKDTEVPRDWTIYQARARSTRARRACALRALGLLLARAGWFGIGSQKVTAFGKLWAVTVIWPLGYMDIPWLNPLYCSPLNVCVEPQIQVLLS